MHEEITAYHEAGHVVMAFWAGIPIESVTIDPERIGDLLPLGVVETKAGVVSIHDFQTVLVGSLAAEIMYFSMSYGDFPGGLPGARADWRQFEFLNHHFIKLVAKKRYGWIFELIEADLRFRLNRDWIHYTEYAFRILTYRWDAVVALAEELLKQRALSGKDAFFIYEYASLKSVSLGRIQNRRVAKIAETVLLPFLLLSILPFVLLGPQIYSRRGIMFKIVDFLFTTMIKVPFFRRRLLK